jgi:hypothetical protein
MHVPHVPHVPESFYLVGMALGVIVVPVVVFGTMFLIVRAMGGF